MVPAKSRVKRKKIQILGGGGVVLISKRDKFVPSTDDGIRIGLYFKHHNWLFQLTPSQRRLFVVAKLGLHCNKAEGEGHRVQCYNKWQINAVAEGDLIIKV